MHETIDAHHTTAIDKNTEKHVIMSALQAHCICKGKQKNIVLDTKEHGVSVYAQVYSNKATKILCRLYAYLLYNLFISFLLCSESFSQVNGWDATHSCFLLQIV